MSTDTVVIINLAGIARQIRWDQAALFRADDTGLCQRLADGNMGYATLCRMIWVMLDEAGRKAHPSPEHVALHVPLDKKEALWEIVLREFNAKNGIGDSEAKNGSGGVAPSPESSSV